MSFRSLLACVSFFWATNTQAQQQTINNLQVACQWESSSASLYERFAVTSEKENLPEISVLFKAIARSERIHAGNFIKLLARAGQKANPVSQAQGSGTTGENLMAASSAERDIMGKRYPFYISTAKNESQNDAAKAMRWAMETEKKHFVCINRAKDAFMKGSVKSLPPVYWICPKCGNIYDVGKPEPICGLCGTSRDRFQKFAK